MATDVLPLVRRRWEHVMPQAGPYQEDAISQGGREYADLRLLTPDEVCALLQVKKSWLYDAVEAGKLEVVRLGKQLRFRRPALERYLAAQSVTGVPRNLPRYRAPVRADRAAPRVRHAGSGRR